MNRKLLYATIFLILLFVFAGSAHLLFLGNAQQVTLPSAPPMAGVISQSLGQNQNGTLPVANVDYHLTTQNFDNNTWVIATITPLHQNFEPSVAVLKNVGGAYTVVINPTNAMPSGQLQGIPSDVAAVLRQKVAVYTPVPGAQ